MKFDKRNPFAAWGHEQEIYTMNGDNETIQFTEEMRGFQTMQSMKDNVFVNNGETNTVTEFTKEPKEAFFTNNENMVEPALIRKRAGKVDENGDLTDIERKLADNYNNAEMNSYGIQAQDLMADTKAHAVEEASEEEASEEEDSEEEDSEEKNSEEKNSEEKEQDGDGNGQQQDENDAE